MPETKTAEQLASEVKALLDTSMDEVKGIAEEALGKSAKNEELTTALKANADEALVKMNETQAILTELQQKMSRSNDDRKEALSPGKQYVESEQFKSMQDRLRQVGMAAQFELKAITSLTTDADGSAGDLAREQRVQSPMAMLPQRQMTIRDLLAPGTTEAKSIEYVQQTGFTNAADMVAESALKPESTMKFDLATAPVRKIAHRVEASMEILDDAAGLASMIDNQLRYGLAFKEETQLLNGDGTGQNILGLVPQATAYAAPITIAPATSIDLMRLAQLQAALAEYPANGHVMNPIDWAFIEMLKDGDGNYIIGQPQGATPPTLWRLPVVTTQAMEVDKFLTGAFSMAAQVFDRMQATIMTSSENKDNFEKNMITILGEERLALAVYRPEAFVYGDFGRVT